MPAKILQQSAKRLKKVKVDTVTIDIIESALRNARFEMERCCSVPQCRPASASSTMNSR